MTMQKSEGKRKEKAMKDYRMFLAALVVLFAPTLAQPQTTDVKKGPEILPHVSITVLVDNMAGGGPILGEWGASFVVQANKDQILIDAGQGQVLLGNARALEADLSKTKAIVISHEHLDHTQGLDSAFRACGPVDFYVHPAGFETRYWKDGSHAEPHSLPYTREELTKRVRRLIETKEPTKVAEGIIVTGQIPRTTDFEDTGLRGVAFLDANLSVPDPVVDDQAVFFRVPEGVVIVLGCGHAGLVNTMNYVSKLTGERRIYAVIGGTHLISASSDRLKRTIEALRQYDVQKVMLSHCTGARAFSELACALPGRCTWPASGSVIEFGGK